jgi:hypothetical protein
MAHPAKNIFGGRSQVNHMAALMQVTAVGFAQDGTTPRRDHTLVGLSQVIEDLLLNIAEAFFSFAGKKLPDRTPQSVLNHMVGIHKRQAKAARQLPTNGGFARARKAHKDDAQESLTLEKVGLAASRHGQPHRGAKCIRPLDDIAAATAADHPS